MRTLKQQFLSTALAIAFFLLALGFFTHLAIRRTLQNHQLASHINALALLEVEMDNTQKSFLMLESVNPDFFVNGKSDYAIRMDSLFLLSKIYLSALKTHRISRKLDIYDKALLLEQHLDTVKELFSSLAVSLRSYGYESYGLSGQMRRHIHAVEQALVQENHFELSTMMLTLRRHEKDFMLRKDKRYLDRFDQAIYIFVARMTQMGIEESLISGVKNYQQSFHELAAMELHIGTSAGEGLLGLLLQKFDQTRPLINQVKQDLDRHISQQVRFYMSVLLIAFLLIPAGMIAVYGRLSGRITTRMLFLRDYLIRMGEGELPNRIEYHYKDEIGQMIQSVNNLNQNLKNTREFALEVGKGNFQTQIDVFGNQGDLGGSLIQMKTQLEKVAKDQETQKLQETQRTWHAEGSALFANILRNHPDNLDAMAFAVIKNLVDYLDLCQGGLFSIEEVNQQEKYFRLAACYAYDRKKFMEKKIDWGEGLLGAAALEQEPVYITDLPSDYMHITSGLGQTRPASLLVVPLVCDEGVFGVLELASIEEIPIYKRAFVEKIAQSISSHMAQLKNRLRTSHLLKKSEGLAESLRLQEEELRQSMEEMKASQEEAERTMELLKRELTLKERELNVLKMGDFVHMDTVLEP